MRASKFHVGDSFTTENYETSTFSKIEILKRSEKWALISLNGKQRQVRINIVKNPEGESLLISDHNPIFSFSAEDY